MDAKEKPFEFVKNKKYKIPRYQRRYVWDMDNWERLLDEWEYGEDNSHFLGSVIIKNFYTSNTGEAKRMEIVDGQQRMITLTILYKALYDLMSEEDKIRKEEIKNGILGVENDLIVPSHLDEEDYKYVMSKKVDIDSIILEDVGRGAKRKIKSSNIQRCYKYFYTRLESEKENRDKLWKELNNSNKILFVVIDVNDNDDAQQIFDCINSAGVKLSLSELVKNKLISKLCQFGNNNEEEDYKKYWKQTFESDYEIDKYWSEVKSIGKYKKTNIDIFLYCFAIIKGFFNIEDRMSKLYSSYYKKIETILSREEMIDFCNELNECANIYRENMVNDISLIAYTFDDKTALCLLALEKLSCTTFYPYCLKLLSDKNLVKEEKNKKFEILLKLILRVALCNDTTTSKNYNKICYKLATGKNINDISSINHNEDFTIEEYYYDRVIKNDVINDVKIKENLINISNRNATLMLFLLELYYRRNKDMNGLNPLNYVFTLEHIMPQKYAKYWGINVIPVRSYDKSNNKYIDFIGTDEQKNDLRENAIYDIGNMLLLSKGLNTIQQNFPLYKKIKLYKDRCSNLQVNRDFLNNLQSEVWNEETIHKRSKRIVNDIIKYVL